MYIHLKVTIPSEITYNFITISYTSYPVVIPGAGDEGRTEGPRGVHGGAGVVHRQ